jgi:P pilus assembly chaperone PapD
MYRLAIAGLISALTLTAQAAPNINVGPIFDYLDASQSAYLKRIANNGDSTAFVRVNIAEIHYAADGTRTEIPVDTAGPIHQRTGLVASPARLIIPARGMQATRLLYMGERDRERYFRVRYVPVLPEKEDQFAVSEAEREAYNERLSAGVNVMASYGAIFFVRPAATRFDTRIEETAARYSVHNAGNSTVVLDHFRDCSSSDERDCKATRLHHVMPGKTFAFDRQPGRVYRFNLTEGNDHRPMHID